MQYNFGLKGVKGEFPGGPVVRARRFHCQGPGSVPGQGNMILQASRHGQKKKKERFEMMSHPR